MSDLTTSRDIFEGATDDPWRLAVRAYVWGFAPVLATKIRQGFTSQEDPSAPRSPAMAAAPLNNMGHQRQLADATLKIGVAPNVDTLYSLAWLDLAREPFVLEAPDFGARYYTFQMGYGDSAADLSLGSRTHGGQLPSVFIAGPHHADPAPPGMLHVACPTRFLLVAGRILVRPDDPRDYAAVYALQSRIRLRPLGRYRAGAEGPNPVPGQRPLDEGSDGIDPALAPLNQVGNVLRDWVVRPGERALIDSFGAIALTPAHGFRTDRLTQAARREIVRGLADGAAAVERKTLDLGRNVNGWTINYRGPRFGDDYLLRAAVAKDQIYVVVPEEAIYPVAKVDAAGQPLTGEHAYCIRFAPGGLPPVDAFWSLTLYARGGPLVANPIGRYAIGDRTAGLVIEADGAIVITIQATQPADVRRPNWLPAPKGPFHLMLRLYVPRAEVWEGAWAPPPVQRLPSQ